MIRTVIIVFILSMLEATGAPERIFTVRGVVRSPYADGVVIITHEPIPEFMPAMTMRFNTTEAEARGLAAGDAVEFEFRVGEKSHASKFRKVGRVAVAPALESKSGAIPTRRLRPGDRLPPFSLIDQDARPLTDANLRGDTTILTFIFTRCAVPEFCPLLAKKFQSLQEALARESPETARTKLLSISIDPQHDRPDILRHYGVMLKADFERWRFATGSTEEIEKLLQLFTVRAEKNAGTVDHTLATALIDTDGKLVSIWRGNAWKPEEILNHLRTLRTAPP